MVILEQFAGVKGLRFARATAALMGWNLFLVLGGRAYPFDDVASWLDEAGFPRAMHKGLRHWFLAGYRTESALGRRLTPATSADASGG